MSSNNLWTEISCPILQDDVIVVAKGWKDKKYWLLGDVRKAPVGSMHTKPIDINKLPELQQTLDPWRVTVEKIKPSSSNRSKEAANLLIYNRVPKCGSTSVTHVTKRMSGKLGFNTTSSGAYWSATNTKEDEQKLVEQWNKIKYPHFFDKHFYFVDIMRSVLLESGQLFDRTFFFWQC